MLNTSQLSENNSQDLDEIPISKSTFSFKPSNHPLQPPRCSIAPWVGRLIFDPSKRIAGEDAVGIQIQLAPEAYQYLVGKTVLLQWTDTPGTKSYMQKTTRNVVFSSQAKKQIGTGYVLPTRLDGFRKIGPLESLAGSRPLNDVHVMLTGDVVCKTDKRRESSISLSIEQEPTQVSGATYSVVEIVCPVNKGKGNELFQVTHFDPQTKDFSGITEIICIPNQVAEGEAKYAHSTVRKIEKSKCNKNGGWYIFGENNEEGIFTVQSFEPRCAVTIKKPNLMILGNVKTAKRFVAKYNWKDTPSKRGKLEVTLLDQNCITSNAAMKPWKEGNNYLVIHLSGGMMNTKHDARKLRKIVPGHFAYGAATIIRDPLTKELCFDIIYNQVCAHNKDGIVSGRTARSCYLGDLKRGWLNSLPVSDVLVDLDVITKDYHFGDTIITPFKEFQYQLQIMMARYRVGDGDGISAVTATEQCSQDSNQALYVTIDKIENIVMDSEDVRKWLRDHPNAPDTIRFHSLQKLGRSISRQLAPLDVDRHDWKHNANGFAGAEKEGMFTSCLQRVKRMWTIMPRRSHDDLCRTLLNHGAALWFIRTNQVGGKFKRTYPLAPGGRLLTRKQRIPKKSTSRTKSSGWSKHK